MKLISIALIKLPGFDHRSLTINTFGPGLNIVFGPNGSGKSTICRTIRKLLWGCQDPQLMTASLQAEWEWHGETFTIGLEEGRPYHSTAAASYLEKLPEKQYAHCFNITIDDLFDSRDDTFARRIATAMAGGYDLTAAQEAIAPTKMGIRTAIGNWKDTKEEYTRYRRQLSELRAESDQLPTLEVAIADAKNAAEKAEFWSAVAAVKEIDIEIAALEKRVADSPEPLQLGLIDIGDCHTFGKFLNRIEQLEAEISKLKGVTNDLERRVGHLGDLSTCGVNLELQLDRIARIQQLHNERENKLASLANAETTLKGHARLLAIDCDQLAMEKIDAANLDTIEELWRDIEIGEGKINALEEQLSLNRDVERIDISNKEEVAFLLAQYLSLRRERSWPFLASLLALSCATVYFLEEMRAIEIALISSVAFFSMGALLLRQWRQRNAMKQLSQFGYQVAEAETTNALRAAVAECGKAHCNAIRLAHRDTLLQLLSCEKASQKERRATLDVAAQQCGINALPELRFRFCQYIKKLHDSWIDREILWRELKLIDQRLEAEWNAWHSFATPFGMSNDKNVFELGRRHAHIKEQITALTALKQSEIDLAAKQRQKCELELLSEQFLIDKGCRGESALLQKLVSSLPHFQNQSQKLVELKKKREKLCQGIPSSALEHINTPFSAIETAKHAEEAHAETLPLLTEKKGRLLAKIEQAEQGALGAILSSKLNLAYKEVCSAARDFARKELLELMVRDSEREFRRHCQPRVLQLASEWFLRFTKHRYSLEAPLKPNGEIVYEAVDTATRERKTLPQLSRATRMQLLMAVRLAFAFVSEGKGDKLPLFLDELLANSDPERFDAIAELLSDIAADGRQLIYFTSNPDDILRWQRHCPDVALVDLAQLRGEQAFAAAPLPAKPQQSRYPPPRSDDSQAYAAELKLPALRPDLPLEMTSIHYLTSTSDELRRLLLGGINCVGQFKEVETALIAKQFKASAPMMARRAFLLEKFFSLAKRGRGKPLSKTALLRGGVSSVFIDRLWQLAQELKGDSKLFIATLEEKRDLRSKRFPGEAITKLKEFLQREGYYDPQSPLSEEQLRQQFLLLSGDNLEELLFLEQCYSESQHSLIESAKSS